MSNSLDPDQAQRFVGPDLGPICLQRLSADNTSRSLSRHGFRKGELPADQCLPLILNDSFLILQEKIDNKHIT